MREPYETLLGEYRDHPLMNEYVAAETPDFSMLKSTDWESLSSSEQKMWLIALAFWNGDRRATIADLAALDTVHLNRFVMALERGRGKRQ